MTKSEAKAEQERLVKEGYNLAWWYGTDCDKCCDVFPKLMKEGNSTNDKCFYMCPVCGKRTESFQMPWIAEDAWNAGQFAEEQQTTIFSLL